MRWQWLRSLQRCRFIPGPAQWVKGLGIAAAVACIQSLAGELPDASGATIKQKKIKNSLCHNIPSLENVRCLVENRSQNILTPECSAQLSFYVGSTQKEKENREIQQTQARANPAVTGGFGNQHYGTSIGGWDFTFRIS